MKRLLLLGLAIWLCAEHANARLGETPQEIAKRYGGHGDWFRARAGLKGAKYFCSFGEVSVIYDRGLSVCENVCNYGLGANLGVHTINLTNVLSVAGAIAKTMTWRRIRCDDSIFIYAWHAPEVGAVALFNPKNRHLLVHRVNCRSCAERLKGVDKQF
jgi:hypothetical protein